MNNKTNKLVLNSLGLPLIQSKEDFGELLHLSPSLIHILTRDSAKYKYRIFKLPKKHGGYREIYAPKYSLKIIQRWVLENILYKIKPSSNCYGYIKGIPSPLKENADRHKSNLFILKLDIKDFFPSIQSFKVLSLFESIGYNKEVSVLLTNICTCDNHIPQGAVTSPYLSNLLCIKLDLRLHKYCSKRDITFTRYADDLTFSGNNRDNLKKIFNMLCKILRDEGFGINDNKTIFLSPKTKKNITGVTISDDKLKAPNEMKRIVRSLIHRAIVAGDYSQANRIKGYIAYICSIEDDYKAKITKYIENFCDDPITLNEDAVEAFNKNKFFSNLRDMRVRKPSFFTEYDNEIDFIENTYNERQEYLKKHGYIL